MSHDLAALEALEGRTLMSVSYNPVTHELSLIGTVTANAFSITEISSASSSGNTIRVYEGLGYTDYPAASKPITLITANLGDGDDVVTMEPAINIRLVANGGIGLDDITGGAAGDEIYGGDDSDDISGNGGVDYIRGGPGVDFIHGNAGNDIMYGEGENDFLYGHEGSDFISGGDDSNDYIEGGTENDTLNGDEGNDTIDGEDGEDLIFGDAGADSLLGGANDDVIRGEDQNDVLEGGDGNDELDGGNQNDLLIGDLGDDLLDGGSGNDTMYGREGVDTLNGDSGNDILRGEDQKDYLTGGTGTDDADGGSGHDDISGDDDNDTLDGGNGSDTVRGGAGADLMYGAAGHDALFGGEDYDVLIGDGGIDALHGGIDGIQDSLYGGAGSDRFLDTFSNVLFVNDWEDDHRDRNNDDVRIGFFGGEAVDDMSLAGQAGTYDFAAGTWTEEDIEKVDIGLAVLHEATGNKVFLETATGHRLDMIRLGALTQSNGGNFSAAAWNSGDGEMTYCDNAFDNVGTPTTEVIIHELGHNWDNEYDYAGWQALSGWVSAASSPGANFALGSDVNGNWWYDTTQTGFVSTYALTNPMEDFAESFANYFLVNAGMDFAGDSGTVNEITAAAMQPKETFFNDMVIALS